MFNRIPSLRRARAFLAGEPGPTPWYYPPRELTVGQGGVSFRWQDVGAGPSKHGVTLLVDERGCVYSALGMYCYARLCSESRLVVWHEASRAGRTPAANAEVHFHGLDLESFQPFSDADEAEQALAESSERVVWNSGSIGSRSLSVGLPPGSHAISFPATMRDLAELFVLVSPPSTDPTGPALTIWIVRPRAGTVEVLPQPWFNPREWDIGYQWVTRVGREPGTGRLVGDGIRMGTFVLDERGTGIAKWLERTV